MHMHTNYKEALEQEKQTLLGELAGLGKRDPLSTEWEATLETPEVGQADPNNTADRFEDFEEKSALIIPLEARLEQVESALARIQNGGFGLCRVCSNPIEDARLLVNPAAETCMTHIEG